MSSPRLTETSYIVLGLLDLNEPATPYDLKQLAKLTVFNFWSVPHTQIYTECERLAEAGLLDEEREEGGRRRRFYKLTRAGRAALDKWRGETTDRVFEGRDLAALKLFFGTNPRALAEAQLEVHKARLDELEAAVAFPGVPAGMRLTTELGINQERALVRFWSRLASGG
jgi:PadR family transcriptional regulator, regulatory protein AphA